MKREVRFLIVGAILATGTLFALNQNDIQAQEQSHVYLPIVLNGSIPTSLIPTPPPEQEREFNLSLNLKEQEGVAILNDRSDWDGRANNFVSFVTVNGTAEFLFQRWGPPGKWDTVEAEKTVTLGEGTYNLTEWEEGIWNDTLQKVTIAEGDIVVLSEQSDGSGITIILVG